MRCGAPAPCRAYSHCFCASLSRMRSSASVHRLGGLRGNALMVCRRSCGDHRRWPKRQVYTGAAEGRSALEGRAGMESLALSSLTAARLRCPRIDRIWTQMVRRRLEPGHHIVKGPKDLVWTSGKVMRRTTTLACRRPGFRHLTGRGMGMGAAACVMAGQTRGLTTGPLVRAVLCCVPGAGHCSSLAWRRRYLFQVLQGREPAT